MATTVIAMWILDWRLTLLSLGLMPVFAYITYRVGKVRREVSTLTQRSMAEMSAITEESLSVSGILLSKTFGQQEASIERFRAESQRLGDLQVRGQMIGRWFFALIGTFFSIMPAFVYLLAGSLIIGGDTNVSIGTIVAFTTLQSRLFFPLGQLLNVQVEIQGALALFDRIFEYLEMDHEITDAPDAVELSPDAMRGGVRFDDVSFRYPVAGDAARGRARGGGGGGGGARGADLDPALRPDRPQLRRPRPGQLVALVGPSGSGKTTSTYLIPRLYDVDSGSVSIDGVDVRGIKLESLGQVIGFVTQETYLFHDTVLANLRYAKPDATMEEIEEAARAAAIHERIMELPDGYDTVVGERGYKLSGGEKQRVAIARVLLKDPRILILDEATSALDTVSERLIQAALQRLMEGRTTIAIAHRLSTILRADQILVMARGRIVERGTHDELLRAGGAVRQALPRAVRRRRRPDDHRPLLRPRSASSGTSMDVLPKLLTRDTGFVWVDLSEAGRGGARRPRARLRLPSARRSGTASSRPPCRRSTPTPTTCSWSCTRRSPAHGGHVDMLELDQFIGRRYLVTVHEAPHGGAADGEDGHRETSLVLGRIDADRFRAGLTWRAVVRGRRRAHPAAWSSTPGRWQSGSRISSAASSTTSAAIRTLLLESMFRLRHELLSVRTIAVQSREVYARVSGLVDAGDPGRGPAVVRRTPRSSRQRRPRAPVRACSRHDRRRAGVPRRRRRLLPDAHDDQDPLRDGAPRFADRHPAADHRHRVDLRHEHHRQRRDAGDAGRGRDRPHGARHGGHAGLDQAPRLVVMPKHPSNRLIDETSPYLLQHAHNPVDWYPWGPEALDKARAQDRPIFLSIGYAACHWCHVMERESFENPEIAALMNEHFVSIKVDREERPDLDDVYMAAVQAMTGSGGWPMSVFLTPDLRPFFGGTYFPPDDRHGMAGFPRVLASVADAYRTRRAEVEQQAGALAEHLQAQLAVPTGDRDPERRQLEAATARIAASFDAAHGGFGGAPKFPPP